MDKPGFRSSPLSRSNRREEAREQLRRAAAGFDLVSADWRKRHPSQSITLALLLGWQIARYPLLRRLLLRLLIEKS